MAVRYVTVADLREFTRDEKTLDDDLLTEAIEAAEQEFDNATGRRWEVASSSSARSFVPRPGSRALSIWDCTAVASVVENGTTLTEGTDYQLEPVGGFSDSGQSVPYSRIRRLGACWYTDDGEATVAVTATWGWAAIPSQVKMAAKIIAKDALEQRDVRHGLVAIADTAGGVGSRTNAYVRNVIEQYRSIRTWGVA